MNNKLKEIEIENIIIYIYYILLTIYLYANRIEVKYLKTKNIKDKETYQVILYIVFGISIIISLYYTINSLNELKEYNNSNIKNLKILSVFASFLILIANVIILYIIQKDENIDLEISP